MNIHYSDSDNFVVLQIHCHLLYQGLHDCSPLTLKFSQFEDTDRVLCPLFQVEWLLLIVCWTFYRQDSWTNCYLIATTSHYLSQGRFVNTETTNNFINYINCSVVDAVINCCLETGMPLCDRLWRQKCRREQYERIQVPFTVYYWLSKNWCCVFTQESFLLRQIRPSWVLFWSLCLNCHRFV